MYNVTTSMVRDWVKNLEELQRGSKDRQVGTHVVRRLPGAGRKPEYIELE
ncbi:hypothetical protein PR003_g31036 [Phytophthora rubi]|uniref:Uncharacterized protein n=1 Tax=Phytophthora rubi TaxID=129364 RepID=A0A6A4BCW8_9STRA|nr:hypothetical protein PR002_g29593 [Phytophthora rubi]KAE9269801.1 hypothetical protein PR003_g31036 [Phytophthora rubi]